MIKFISFVKKIISDEKMPNLSEMGWKRMRAIERELNNGTIKEEDAIKSFLSERNGDYEYGLRNKYKMEDHLKTLKKI